MKETAGVEMVAHNASDDTEHGEGIDLDQRTAYKSTEADSIQMRRMGRRQELVRHFRMLSVASFVAIATAAWEIGLFTISPGLTNGGRPLLIYSVLWNFIGFGPIYLCE